MASLGGRLLPIPVDCCHGVTHNALDEEAFGGKAFSVRPGGGKGGLGGSLSQSGRLLSVCGSSAFFLE